MSRLLVLKASSDFQEISRQGKRWSCGSFIMQARQRGADDSFRLGLTASRKVGNAVIRNRAKRRLRETVRLHLNEKEIRGWDVVLIAKTAAASCAFEEMRADFSRGLIALKVMA